MIERLDWFGRYCLAWTASRVGSFFTMLGGLSLRFAASMMDFDDINFDEDK